MANTGKLGILDMDRALLDPGSVFASPEDLLAHKDLSEQQKVDLLQRWAYDASEVSVSTEEGMSGDNGELLQRILRALDQLKSGIDSEHVAPTKQHGVSSSSDKPKAT